MVRRALVPLALIGMLGVAALTLGRIYYGDLLPRLVFGAAAASVGLSALVRRLPAWVAAPVSVLGLAGYAYLAIRVSAQAGQVAGTVPDLARDALRNGIPRLLTAMIPIEPQPDTVIVPVLATWLAGLAAAELALRNRRVLVSYTAPTVLLVAALYLVGPNARPVIWLPLAYAALAAVGLAASVGSRERAREQGAEPVLSGRQRTTLRLRIAGGAVAGLAVIVALATAVGPPVADQVSNVPSDPRRYVTPPQLDSLDENPLVRLSGWALNPDQHLFDARVSTSGGSGGGADPQGTPTASAQPGPAGADAVRQTRIRLAVLSDYDGVTWRVGATYRSAGRILSGPPSEADVDDDGEPAREIEQEITIGELDGRLVPGAATPQRIDGVRVAYDPASGTLALPEGLRSGMRYTVLSRQPSIPVNLLPTADVPTGPDVLRYVTLTGTLPTEMSRLATQLGEAVAAPYQRATAIEQFLAEHYQLVADAPSGHAYPNLNYFLFGPRNAGGQKGTSEQFAAAFAVLGRALGLPTRVVVGFQAKVGGTSPVRGADAFAWPEVLFTGIGWVAFNPLPQPNSKARPVEEDFRPRPDPSTPPPTVLPTPSTSAVPRPSRSASAAGPEDSTVDFPVAAVAIGTGGMLGTALIGFLVAVPLLRAARRRRRLWHGDPAHRIVGAWQEVLDGLRLAGRPAPDDLAATEVAQYAITAATGHERRRTRLRLSPPPIDELANLVNQVAYAPPGRWTPEVATRAAHQADAYVAELRARRPRWRRLLWRFDPRPLRWKEGPPDNGKRGTGAPS